MPSSGSMIQRFSASALAPLAVPSSARIAWSGYASSIVSTIVASAVAVDLADEVLRPLGGDGEQVEVARAAIDEVAGAARRLHRDGERRMHGRDCAAGVEGRRDAAKSEDAHCNRCAAVPGRPPRSAACSAVAICPRLPRCPPLDRFRIVLVAHQPSRQHRRRGARDADDGALAARAGEPARFPDPEAVALASGATAVLDARARRRHARRGAGRRAC